MLPNQTGHFKMELRIDLSDRTDIEAAAALLAVILGNTKPESPVGNDAPSGADAGALPSVPAALLAGVPNDTNASTSPDVPTAPTPPVVPPAPVPPVGPVTLDNEGIPHDPRIHAQPPSINKSGEWRAKRGLNDEAAVNRIKAELKALMAIPPGGAPVATAPVAPPVSVPPAPTASVAPVPPVTPVVPAGVTDVPAPTTPQELIPRVTAANSAGVLPQSALLEACTAYGLPNIPALFQRPDKVAEVYAYLTMAFPAFK